MSINRLPSRILVQIFSHSTSSDSQNRDKRPSIITITSTCRHWRHLAASMPQLWENIRIPFRFLRSPSQWASRWLELSYPLGVSVHLILDLSSSPANSSHRSRVPRAGRRERGVERMGAGSIDKEWLLRSELHRVLGILTHQSNIHRLLRLRIVASPNVKLSPMDALYPLSTASAPNLQELELSFLRHSRDVTQRVIMVVPTPLRSYSSPFTPPSTSASVPNTIAFPFQSNANLSALALQGCPRIPYPLRNLSSLLLSNVLPTETAFQSLSHESPSLHTLILHNLHSSIHDGGNEVVSQIRFSKLKKLVVGYAKEPASPPQNQYPDRHFHILPYLVVPVIEEMEIGYEDDIGLQYVPDLTRMAPAPSFGVASELGIGMVGSNGTGNFGHRYGRRMLRVRLDYAGLLVSDWSVKESLMGEYFRSLEAVKAPVESVEVALPRRPDSGLTRIVKVDWRDDGSLRREVDRAFQ